MSWWKRAHLPTCARFHQLVGGSSARFERACGTRSQLHCAVARPPSGATFRRARNQSRPSRVPPPPPPLGARSSTGSPADRPNQARELAGAPDASGSKWLNRQPVRLGANHTPTGARVRPARAANSNWSRRRELFVLAAAAAARCATEAPRRQVSNFRLRRRPPAPLIDINCDLLLSAAPAPHRGGARLRWRAFASAPAPGPACPRRRANSL